MEDKMLMEGLLWDTKVLADLCLHGSIESATKDVHEAFLTGLKDVLTMQNDIYTLMSNEGWYPTEQVEQKKIDQVIQKFSTMCDKKKED